MKAFVYILKSESGKYYIGSTNDLNRRMSQHLNGHTYSTLRMKGLRLAFSQEYESLQKARLVENKLKSFKRKDFIEKIIKEGYIKVQ